jgi:cardiolipin synthase
VQLIAIGFLLAGPAGDELVSVMLAQSSRIITEVGIGLLWLSALVTLYTGWDYFRAGVRHLIDE